MGPVYHPFYDLDPEFKDERNEVWETRYNDGTERDGHVSSGKPVRDKSSWDLLDDLQ